MKQLAMRNLGNCLHRVPAVVLVATLLTMNACVQMSAPSTAPAPAPTPATKETSPAANGGEARVATASSADTGARSAETPLTKPSAPQTAIGGGDAEEAFKKLLGSMGVQYLAEQRRVEIAGWVNMQKGLVEVFACAPEGKTHEAVVVLDCVPSGLHAGLLALGLEPGTPVEVGTEGEYKLPTGDRVQVRVRWTGADGNEHTVRAEDWVRNEKEGRPMKPGAWIFAGSFMQPVSDNPEESTYAANYVKSLVTTYHDASSILENPHSEGVDDTVYYANEKAVPAVGTPVTVVFVPAK